MSKEILSRHVKDALENLYDPIRLQIHPLLDLLDVPRGPGQSAGEALRQLLWDVIESLRPPESMPPGRPEWLSYHILWLHYAQAMDRPTICQQLALSEASFYRRQREGLDAVTDILYERHRRDRPREAVPTSIEPLSSEAKPGKRLSGWPAGQNGRR